MVPPSAFKSDPAIVSGDPVSRAETIPTTSPSGFAAVDPQPASEQGARDIAQKPFCLRSSPSDRSCPSFQLPKVRMVRVPTPGAASVGHQGDSAKPTTANSKATEPDKGIAETKKAQRSAHRQNQRRNRPGAMSGSPIGRREATVAKDTRVISGESPLTSSRRN
jgi:hypothetical protein